jgi:hypothetical protein
MDEYNDDIFFVDTDIIFKYSIYKTYTSIFSQNYDFFVPQNINATKQDMYYGGLMYFKNTPSAKLMLSTYCKKILSEKGIYFEPVKGNWFFDQIALYDVINEMKRMNKLSVYNFYINMFCKHEKNIVEKIINNNDIYFIAPRNGNNKDELEKIINITNKKKI